MSTDSQKQNQQTADALFAYLRDIIYDPAKANLDIDELPKEFQQLAQGLEFVRDCAMEQREFAHKIISGDLETDPPSIENGLAAPLKSVQGSLIHLAWQAQEVAKGDYKQHVDFMGSLGDAFNQMTTQLAQRETSLREKSAALEASNRELLSTHQLMMDLALESSRYILIYNIETDACVFKSDTAREFELHYPQASSGVRKTLLEDVPEDVVDHPVQWDRFFNTNPCLNTSEIRHATITSHSITWGGQPAIAHLLIDDTEEEARKEQMESMAYADPLTGLHNRRFAMAEAQRLIDKEESFCLIFIDLDNLKYCNDKYGHTKGDEYITLLPKIIEHEQAPGSMLCRIGGDEFMVLCPGADAAELHAWMDRAREEMVASPVPEDSEYLHSFSFGIVDVSAPATHALGDYLSEADYLMYNFKYANKPRLKIENRNGEPGK